MESTDEVLINIDSLLALFNKKDEGRKDHVSVLIAFIGEELVAALFMHYMNSKGTPLARCKFPPIQKMGSGNSRKKLDCWFYSSTRLYQAEIKSWSIYSYGINDRTYDKGVGNYQKLIRTWIREEKINKVFLDMEVPHCLNGMNPKPLLCFWFPINRNENNEAFIEDQHLPGVSTKHFDIFSASNYLQQYQGKTIKLSLPDTNQRLRLLDSIQKK